MPDVFTPEELTSLFRRKTVFYVGDSNVRGLYKDLVWLSSNCSYTPQRLLKAKLEQSFAGDRLVDGLMASRGRDYREVRHYRSPDGLLNVCFMFCTRIYSAYMRELLDQMREASPDLVIVSSCVWDISRWGPRGVEEYKVNLRQFLQHVQLVVRPDTMLVWLTAMPVSSEPRGGFLIKQVEFLRHTLRFDVMEANSFCASMVREFGYDVLDVHYQFRCLIHHRNRDGIHWSPRAIRAITNMLLTHICLSWNRHTPGRGPGRLLQRAAAESCLSPDAIQDISGRPLTAGQLAAARYVRGDQAPGTR